MNDFAIDITGLIGVLKPRRFCKAGASVKERSFMCVSGWGCRPDINTGRKVLGHWVADGSADEISSYDLEYVIKAGKRIDRLPEETTEVEEIKKIEEGK